MRIDIGIYLCYISLEYLHIRYFLSMIIKIVRIWMGQQEVVYGYDLFKLYIPLVTSYDDTTLSSAPFFLRFSCFYNLYTFCHSSSSFKISQSLCFEIVIFEFKLLIFYLKPTKTSSFCKLL